MDLVQSSVSQPVVRVSLEVCERSPTEMSELVFLYPSARTRTTAS
jgi:hypothetical protein